MQISKSIPAVSRKLGMVRTLRLAWRELVFDPWNGTETSLDGMEPAPSRVRYPTHAGANPLIFAELMARLSVEKSASVLLDLGSGKGRALLLAAQHGFQKAVGVELSPALCELAQRNIAQYRKRHPAAILEVHCAEAATFEVPVEVNVAFFYNPFGSQVMLRVIDRIVESIARAPREFHVVYLNPRFADLFADAGFTTVYRQGTDGLLLVRPA